MPEKTLQMKTETTSYYQSFLVLLRKKRGAAFVCEICYIDEVGTEQYVRGECRGKIGYEPIGENGFGYDPLFMYGEKIICGNFSRRKK